MTLRKRDAVMLVLLVAWVVVEIALQHLPEIAFTSVALVLRLGGLIHRSREATWLRLMLLDIFAMITYECIMVLNSDDLPLPLRIGVVAMVSLLGLLQLRRWLHYRRIATPAPLP
jgi:hypothetical protein